MNKHRAVTEMDDTILFIKTEAKKPWNIIRGILAVIAMTPIVILIIASIDMLQTF